MKRPSSDSSISASDDASEHKNDRNDKRDRSNDINRLQQPGQASGNNEASLLRPPKTRRLQETRDENTIPPKDDPLALARKALEMFRKEVEDDGDYVEPDTRPVHLDEERNTETSSKSSQQPKTSGITGISKWQKAGHRQPMISDDPSIL
eukprot:CAMPEP_0176062354 /NCGR_PEP_ID=MMETSP0120_2-20121206/31093_1 /TAXON_ID=160619 /ORGANISM="Kryptoperidinium foliaceum, Strain CCMP 1326" /LENGTH=149 /DNA_ID=CAMNT_0017395919 /DNA_START=155 /DNA_END=604 /DNA_ORIENTATION=+